MSDRQPFARQHESAPIAFARHLGGSRVFKALFKEGMTLVEETASYLDGPGRAESRRLTRAGALAYTAESMRLTTRLMQLASWLLLQGALYDGEVTPEQAAAKKTKVRLNGSTGAGQGSGWDDLPERLRDLIERSSRLQTRIRVLDAAMDGEPLVAEADNPVRRQLGRIAEAFAAD